MSIISINKSLITAFVLGVTSLTQISAQITLSVYNPQDISIFPVSSEIIYGEKEALLIDAQFAKNDAQAIITQIKESGKALTTIYISHGDPDYYFGLDEFKLAFPDVKILASKQTVAHITKTHAAKLEYWGPILKEQAPKTIIIPDVMPENTLSLENNLIEIKGAKDNAYGLSYIWIPSLKAIVGGVLVSSNIHLWTADTQTKESRSLWMQTLEEMRELNPAVVVPGHYLGERPDGDQAIEFTYTYLINYEKALDESSNSEQVIKKMMSSYPKLKSETSLEMGAKVNKGEIKW